MTPPQTRRTFLKTLAITALAGAGAAVPIRLLSGASLSENFEEPLPEIRGQGLIRPPGALQDNLFRAKCTSCGVCVNVCHVMRYDAIAVAGPGDFRQFGTPYIKDMRDFPCALCMECPRQCPTGALLHTEKEKVSMGMALIDLSVCFGWNGDVCLSCSKACPLGALVFDFYYGNWGNQPLINDACVGCGLCVKYCPMGGSAIKVIRKETYRDVKASYLKEFNRIVTLDHEKRFAEVYERNLPKIMARGKFVEREYR